MSAREEEFPGIVGIDLGTTYSCVAFWDTDHVTIVPNERGSNTTPSWVSIPKLAGEAPIVGEEAKQLRTTNPKGTLYGIKRLLGRWFSDPKVQEDLSSFPFRVLRDASDSPVIHVPRTSSSSIKVDDDSQVTKLKPEQVSALVLEYMKKQAEEYLGKRVSRAVITVPAYFNDSQRMATKNAAMIAGLKCERIINEPTAAALCYGLDKRNDNSLVLVFDLGGGTFDVSVLQLNEGVFEVQSTAGNTHLGGEDFDNALVANVIKITLTQNASVYSGSLKKLKAAATKTGWMRLKAAAEATKRALSFARSSTFHVPGFFADGRDLNVPVTRTMFEQWCEPLFQQCMDPVNQALSDAKLDPTDVVDIVLVGGSTRIPRIQEMLQAFFKRATLNKSVNPDEAVAHGAAVQGAILSKCDPSGKTGDLLLMDVTPLSMGVSTSKGLMNVLIERNENIPTRKSKMFTTSEDNQVAVEVKVYQGERKFVQDNHKLGMFTLTNLPPKPRQAIKIEVTFVIDADGILTVKASDVDTGNQAEMTVQDSVDVSPERIQEMLDQAEEFRAEDELRKEALYVREQLEREISFAQETLCNRSLTHDEDGDPLIPKEQLQEAQAYIMRVMQWLVQDGSFLSVQNLNDARDQFQSELKPVLSIAFTRKKQLDAKSVYVDKLEQAEQDLLNDEEKVQALVSERMESIATSA